MLVFIGGDFAALGGIWWVAGAAALLQSFMMVSRKGEAERAEPGQRGTLSGEKRRG